MSASSQAGDKARQVRSMIRGPIASTDLLYGFGSEPRQCHPLVDIPPGGVRVYAVTHRHEAVAARHVSSLKPEWQILSRNFPDLPPNPKLTVSEVACTQLSNSRNELVSSLVTVAAEAKTRNEFLRQVRIRSTRLARQVGAARHELIDAQASLCHEREAVELRLNTWVRQ
ncbi:hypothetical protein QFC21_004051 [Naganishia friedmannii]|uniref:Uncharacterized protein n=1 Tax=Naganishia friedmannii TaxID=89922 RepID=A0ACC2VJ81_9TREE|nr:hypothetical protein QFC21_004051 [Naganishia friedmannii]